MKKALILYALATIFCSNDLSAQKYDYTWYHGYYRDDLPGSANYFFDFKNFPPYITPAYIGTFMNESSTVMSDIEGNFAFYSPGCSVYSWDHQIMEGGEKLNPGYIADIYCKIPRYPLFISTLVLPDQNERDKYHFFHFRKIKSTETNGSCRISDLLYSIVDMKANDGKGRMIQANKQIHQGCFQQLTANRHANGRDWWILSPSNYSDTIFRYLLKPDTLEGPWVQMMPHLTTAPYEYDGKQTFSPNGKIFAMYEVFNSSIGIYDFDRCTGMLSNPRYHKKPIHISPDHALNFSPDSRYLYSTEQGGQELYQYDMQASDIFASAVQVLKWDGTVIPINRPAIIGYAQNGPDGKLYYWSYTEYVHVVNQPNQKGEACRAVQRAIKLPYIFYGSYNYYPNYRLGPLDGSPCDTLGLDNHPVAEFRYDTYDSTKIRALQFTDVSWYEPAYWRWDFGDPASGTANKSTEQNPEHEFSKAGGYKVCLIAGNQYASDTICKQVWVGVSGTHTLPALPQARVSPNPATDHLRVSLPALLPAHTLRFTLTDVQGRVLIEVQLTDFETDISLTELPKGLYFWFLKVDGEVVQAGKILGMR